MRIWNDRETRANALAEHCEREADLLDRLAHDVDCFIITLAGEGDDVASQTFDACDAAARALRRFAQAIAAQIESGSLRKE